LVVNFTKMDGAEGSVSFTVDCLVSTHKEASGFAPAPLEQGELQVVNLPLSAVSTIATLRLKLPSDVRRADARAGVKSCIREVLHRMPEGPPQLDPVDEMGITDDAFRKLLRNLEDTELRCTKAVDRLGPTARDDLTAYGRRSKLQAEAKALRKKLKQSATMAFKSELKHRKRVLRRLGHTDADGVVQLKGRVACCIDSADELVLSELIFAGALNDLAPPQLTALLSCLVYDEKSKGEQARLRDELTEPLRTLQETARRVGTVAKECRIDLDVDAYVDKMTPGLMEVVYLWSSGSKFVDVMKAVEKDKIFEGSIIRCIRRLEEVLREVAEAAKLMGNDELATKADRANATIKRDIVFAASLYL